MVLYKCSLEASWLKAFLRAYRGFQNEIFWVWTERGIQGKVMDHMRFRLLSFSLSPSDYYARDAPSKVWVQVFSLETFVDAIKRYRIREMVPIEVKEDGGFFVGDVQVGKVVDEKDVYKDVWDPVQPNLSEDAYMTVVVRDFKRIVDSAKDLAKPEDIKVGVIVKDREGTIFFFVDEEKFRRLDFQTYETWLLNIDGNATSVYSFDFFSEALIPGFSDVTRITVMHQSPCQFHYEGSFFTVEIYVANRTQEEFKSILEKKAPSRLQVWTLAKEDVKILNNVARAVSSIYRGDEVWFGANPYDLWFYWTSIDKGYLRVAKRMFETFIVDKNVAGSFTLSSLVPWLRGVETLECWLEGEPAQSMVLVGKAEKVAPKELRSEEFKMALDVPDVHPQEIFKGPKDILSEVFSDAVTAEDEFLVFITSPYEIKVVGKDRVYYRASLPLDGFKLVAEEDYVPVDGRLLKPFSDFLKAFPGYEVSLGRPETSYEVYVGAETVLGEFRILFDQTVDEASKAIAAYKEEMKPPVAPKPEEVKPLPPPPTPTEYVKVLILTDYPQFVGADMKIYGPYQVGEIRELPKENADVLIKQGIAGPPELKRPPPPPKPKIVEIAEDAIKELEAL